MEKTKKQATLSYSLAALLCIVLFVGLGIVALGLDFTLLLFLAWLIAAAFAVGLGYSFSEVEEIGFETAKKGVGPSVIIIAVGVMIGAFMAAGTVPTLLVVGLKVITPKLFLCVTFLLCCVTSVVTGTSWGTIGAVGVAMIGVGAGLHVNPGITAGAIISGAYFGDKMSPVSDSTILSSTMCHTDIWVHIRHMLYTTGPAAVIAAVLYLLIGIFTASSAYDPAAAQGIISSLHSLFRIDIVSLIPLVVVVVLILKRVSTVGSLLIGSLVGALVAVAWQGHDFASVGSFLTNGFAAATDDAFITGLLNRGGMNSMLSLVATILCALGLGGMLTETGLIQPIFDAVMKKANSGKRVLVLSWLLTWLCVMLVPTYNFAFVMVPTIFLPMLKKYGIKSENLSRILEDVGTLGSNLFPWGVGAVFAAGVLGVPTTQSLMFNFLCIITPLISLLYILTGKFITKEE